MSITTHQIKKLFPKAKPALVKAIVEGWPTAEAAYITTPERISQFLANVGAETGGLTAIEENMNYSAERIRQVWPSRFKSVAAAKPYAGQPAKLANKVYGSRLGNKGGSDGWDFRGGGMLQTTGRENYRKMGFEHNPDGLREPVQAFATAVREWKNRGCNALADNSATAAIRRKINGGTNGLDHVQNYLVKARTIFADYKPASAPKPTPAPKPAPKPQPAPAPALDPKQAILKLGATGKYVEDLQTNLTVLGYPVALNGGVFDDTTEKAVKAFQRAHEDAEGNPLKEDGIAGNRTTTAIGAALAAKELKPKLEEARKNVPATAEKEVKAKTSLWTKITGFLGTIAAGGVGWLTGMDWKAIVALGGVVIVMLLILLVLQNQIIAAFRRINEEART